jgi:hypothetical protein
MASYSSIVAKNIPKQEEKLHIYIFNGVLCGGYTSGVALAISTSVEGAIQAILKEYDIDTALVELGTKVHEQLRVAYGLSDNSTVGDWVKMMGDGYEKLTSSFRPTNHTGCWPNGMTFCGDEEGQKLMKTIDTKTGWKRENLRALIEYDLRRCTPHVKDIVGGFAIYRGGGD